jgi:hypothetical protein
MRNNRTFRHNTQYTCQHRLWARGWQPTVSADHVTGMSSRASSTSFPGSSSGSSRWCERLAAQHGSAGVPGSQSVDLRSERPHRRVPTSQKNLRTPKPQRRRLTSGRAVGQPAVITAVNPPRPATTRRADSVLRPDTRPNQHPQPRLLNPLDHDPGQVRQKHAQPLLITRQP